MEDNNAPWPICAQIMARPLLEESVDLAIDTVSFQIPLLSVERSVVASAVVSLLGDADIADCSALELNHDDPKDPKKLNSSRNKTKHPMDSIPLT